VAQPYRRREVLKLILTTQSSFFSRNLSGKRRIKTNYDAHTATGGYYRDMLLVASVTCG